MVVVVVVEMVRAIEVAFGQTAKTYTARICLPIHTCATVLKEDDTVAVVESDNVPARCNCGCGGGAIML